LQCDLQFTERLFALLTKRGRKVWWDKVCLETGKNWEEGFCDGLVNSRVAAMLLSKEALASTAELKHGSRCDNVVLEHALALELHERHLLECIIPVYLNHVGEVGSDCTVKAIEDKLIEHLSNEGLGERERPSESTKSTLQLTMAGMPKGGDALACSLPPEGAGGMQVRGAIGVSST
jgi:hypothetical protein